MNYGHRIAKLRKSKNLTQAELGSKLNVTAQAVSKWENDLSEPDIESIKKMCEIFEISVDEFLGVSKPENDTNEQEFSLNTSDIIIGKCAKCDKAVGPNEYKYLKYRYVPQSILNKVVKAEEDNIYCNECHDKILKIQKNEQLARIEADKQAKAEKSKKTLKKLAIVGIIAILLLSAIIIALYFISPNLETLLSSIFIIGGIITTIILYVWDTFIVDVFGFFCRSFKAPFGLIFDLSLDGIIWFLTVKLALWIIGGILSILFFILGLFVTFTLSLITFPFIATYKLIKLFK